MKLKCPTCGVRLVKDGSKYTCPQCGHAVTIERTAYEQVRESFGQMKKGFGHLPLKEVKRKIVDERDPLTLGIIGVLAYLLARRLPLKIIMMIIMTVVAWLGPWGAMIAAAIPVVWTLHKSTIRREARRQREELGDEDVDDLED